MKIYLDLIFLINIWFDFLILLCVSILLKRNIKLKRIFLGSLFGSLTFLIIFLNLNNYVLIIYKIIISIFMSIITFSYKDLKYTISNISYFYLVSNNSLIIKNNLFNYLILIIISPIIIYIYINQTRKLKDNYSNYHKVDILYKDKLYHLNGYLDTGNNLVDPYKKRKMILVLFILHMKV